jgi:hypothetical protein
MGVTTHADAAERIVQTFYRRARLDPLGITFQRVEIKPRRVRPWHSTRNR